MKEMSTIGKTNGKRAPLNYGTYLQVKCDVLFRIIMLLSPFERNPYPELAVFSGIVYNTSDP